MAEEVFAAAFVTAVAAGFADAAPTGTRWWDVVLCSALAILFVLAGRQVKNLVMFWIAAIAAMVIGFAPWALVALAGAAAALVAELSKRREAELRPIASGATFLALLHLPAVGFFGLPSLLAGAAIVLVLASGYRAAQPATRRWMRRGVALVAAVLLILLAVTAYFGFAIRSSATSGVDAARRGLDSARSGDAVSLADELRVARLNLDRADSLAGSLVLRPLALVPVAAQHHRSLRTATEQALVVTDAALVTVEETDIDRLQLKAGEFDLDLLTEMAPRLDQTVMSLESSIAAIEADRSAWLVPPLANRLQELVDEVSDVLPEARLSAEAARVLPSMLGADGERRYLMLFGSPGESREFGGFVGGYALLGVNQGQLNFIEAGSIRDIETVSRAQALIDPISYPVEFVNADPAFFPQNLTSTPNISVIARAVRDIFPQLRGAKIDGVIYSDPFALAAMTEFTGPIPLAGSDDLLDRDGVLNFIFEDQYVAFDSRIERFSAIGDLARSTAEALSTADLPGPERLGEVLGPVARAGRLQVVTYDDRENAFLASVLLQRNFMAPTGIDSFAVVQTNGTMSKLDLYLHREVTYDVEVSDTGSLEATLQVDLRSEIPDAVPELTFGETDGTHAILLSLYSPHELVEVTVDGQAQEFVVHEEFGFFRYALFQIALPPNEAARATFVLRGVAPEGDYRVGVWAQPLVHLDEVTISYAAPNKEPIAASRFLEESWLFAPNGEPGE